jgi:hypothetical protein
VQRRHRADGGGSVGWEKRSHARDDDQRRACLPAAPASVEESAAAEKQDHDEDDEKRVSVHILNAGRTRPIPSVQLWTPGAPDLYSQVQVVELAHAGMLIFVDGRERPEYVPWIDVEQIDLDRPPSRHR